MVFEYKNFKLKSKIAGSQAINKISCKKWLLEYHLARLWIRRHHMREELIMRGDYYQKMNKAYLDSTAERLETAICWCRVQILKLMLLV
jgi:hypothetical protein